MNHDTHTTIYELLLKTLTTSMPSFLLPHRSWFLAAIHAHTHASTLIQIANNCFHWIGGG